MTSSTGDSTEADNHVGRIAIVGMAGRFPEAQDVAAFWRNLVAGRECICDLDDGEIEDDFGPDKRRSPNYVKRRPILDDIETFDAAFFGMTAREAQLTDPQQRVFLECAWSALEDACLDATAPAAGQIGIFAGCALNTYFLRHVIGDRARARAFTSDYQVGHYQELLGAMQDFVASRVAYKLGLTGPAVTVQSACSTSLLAIAQACQSLQLYQCDAALAGGVSISVPQKRGYESLDGGMVSADGHVRPFDAHANGTVFGSGCGVVVLKRLEDAIVAGDRIYAVIRGTGINNDGGDKVGFTAPSVAGQAAVVRLAHANAGVLADDIDYVEAHGTATPLGDPIEFRALQQAFGEGASRAEPCRVGSVKANIGHLDAAAGVTGLIKAALQLHHGTLVPQINFTQANAQIDLARSALRVDAAGKAWPRGARRRMAGVSAFGVGGTNVHVVLEEAPPDALREHPAETVLLPLSAKTPDALRQMATRLADALEAEPVPALADIAETLARGRRTFGYRATAVGRDAGEAASKLRRVAQQGSFAEARQGAGVAFLLPGQGSQYPGMARRLYSQEPRFAEWVDRGAGLAEPLLGRDIRTCIFDAAPGEETAPHVLRDTTLAQPALYIVEYALAQLWLGRGVAPVALAGHSLGEFVAAALSGVFSFKDGLELVCARGRFMQALPAGGMMAVRGAASAVEALLAPGVEIAAINAPQLVTVAGDNAALDMFAARAEAAGMATRSLHTSHAFHTAAMEPAVTEMHALTKSIPLAPPRIPVASCVTGGWLTPSDAQSPAYWARHCRASVRFADALTTVMTRQPACLLEVGPGRTLSTFAQQSPSRGGQTAVVATLPDFADRTEDAATDLAALGQLWQAGVAIELPDVQGGRRISLPTYPFAKTRHWIDLGDAPEASTTAPQADNAATTISASSQHFAAAVELPMSDHKSALKRTIVSILEDLSGETIGADAANKTFLELGFDSLMLGQVAQRIQKSLGAKVAFRQLLGDLPTIDALVGHLAQVVPAKDVAVTPAVREPVMAPTMQDRAPVAGLDGLIREQLAMVERVIAQQLEAVRTATPGAIVQTPVTRTEAAGTSAATDDVVGGERFRMFEPRVGSGSGVRLMEAQRRLIDDLIRRSDAKFGKSKADTQTHRRVQADPRSASGFRAEWKDLVYPLVVSRSKGSKLWDIDGNAFVDLVNGFGQTMFGHAPAFVTEAIGAQLAEGFAIGPQTPLAGEVAARLSTMLGHERIAFCNTGSEAVMAAMRVARAVTGRSKVVFFGGDYHGQFDEVLAKGLSKRATTPGAQPAASGITREAVANIVVLPYDTPESLEYIRSHRDELAAVLVEPVQSRNPGLLPRDFLFALRSVTESAGIALIFDEVVTGFRVHQAGVQGLLGLKPDMATYGKVLGGGMPIGILAGVARFMDALDGGQWQFGDGSVPEVAPTFFAGTFVRHPLTLAAARAVLDHLEAGGARVQEDLSAKTADLVARMNASLERRGVASRIDVFSSFFYFNVTAEDPLASLLYPLMRLEGVHIADGFPCFLTTAHSDADIAHIAAAFEHALDALQGAGILAPQRVDPVDARGALRQFAPTAAQREIYGIAQLGGAASCAFNESVSITIDGRVDVDVLQATFGDLVARHDALRSRFGETGEMVTISDDPGFVLERRDLSGERDPSAALAALVSSDARTPFDLANGPLVRAMLTTLAADKHVLVLTAHHIVCDGWSINTLIGEMTELYRARLAKEQPRLAEVLPFSTFAQSPATDTEAASETRAFWTGMYRDTPAELELPSDRPRPERRTWSGATASDTIDGALTGALKQLAARQKTTLFTVLFSALQAMVGRLADADDVVLTVPMAGQANQDERSLVGHCVNFLPVRCAFKPEQSFASHLAAVHATMLRVLKHQDMTLGTLVGDLALSRTIGRTPLSDVQFNLERLADELSIPGAQLSVAPNAKSAVNFDLFFNVIEGRDGLRVDVDYSTDLYDAATIRRWIGHYRALLRSVVAASDTAIAKLPLMDAADRDWLVDGLNATARPYDRSATVHGLISAQARRTPNATAVVCNGMSASYQDIERASDRLAGTIQRQVPGRGGRIAIAVERSVDMLVSLIAVMKAGHAYVPLDPTHPPQRLKATLDAARVSALISTDGASASWAGSGVVVLALDALRMTAAADEARGFGSQGATADDPAYVIFTSGSTGVPKGVEVGQRAVVNFLLTMAETPGFTARDHLLAVTTVCFDIAGLELFLPLVTGGSLTIATREQVRDGFALVDLLEVTRATALQATPSLWQMLLEAGLTPRRGLKMLCGGEPLPRDLADRLIADGAELWNMYGPTETTIWSSCGRVDGGPITIGAPIANTQLFVLDPHDQLRPIGIPGDLYIGGDGLANGYFDRGDLTAAAFRTIEIAPGRTQRLYRTGDVAKRMTDGTLQLQGRRDQQIKLRGYRIEIEEIESVLRKAPRVAAAAVSVRDGGGDDARLVAYIVPSVGGDVQTKAILAHAASALPDYMVPAGVVLVETLPQTGNGKLDRKALKTLPLPGAAQEATKRSVAAAAVPRGETAAIEAKIAAVWREVMNRDAIPRDLSIFEFGADSLHIFRVAARLHALGVPIRARDLLANSTIAQQAEYAHKRVMEAPVQTTASLAAGTGHIPLLSNYRAGAMRNKRSSG